MKKIQCNKCGKEKTIDEFNVVKNKRGYHVWCKSCLKEYDHNRHKKNAIKIRKQKKERRILIKEWFENLKVNLKCKKCEEDHIATLVFHHKDPQEKEHNVSDMVRSGFSIKNIEEEIEKCIVLCANCHRKLHWEEKIRAVG